jgi:uncharacterized membrane protein
MNDDDKSLAGVLVRGMVVALPTLLLAVALIKGYQLVYEGLMPVLNAMPGVVFHSPALRFAAVVVHMTILLLAIGTISRTQLGRKTGRRLELAFLSRLPLYNTLRALASGLSGHEDAQSMKAVLVEVDVPGLQQFGFVVDRLADGRSAVYLPSSPNPGSGSVVIVSAERIKELPVNMRRILSCLGRWGQGTAGLLENNTTKEA